MQIKIKIDTQEDGVAGVLALLKALEAKSNDTKEEPKKPAEYTLTDLVIERAEDTKPAVKKPAVRKKAVKKSALESGTEEQDEFKKLLKLSLQQELETEIRKIFRKHKITSAEEVTDEDFAAKLNGDLRKILADADNDDADDDIVF